MTCQCKLALSILPTQIGIVVYKNWDIKASVKRSVPKTFFFQTNNLCEE